MTLGNANTDVQQLVASGQVSATTAVQIVRQHGEEAGKVLGSELNKAKATGKSKVTAGSMRGPTTPRQRLEAIRSSTGLHQSNTAGLLGKLGANTEPAYRPPRKTTASDLSR